MKNKKQNKLIAMAQLATTQKKIVALFLRPILQVQVKKTATSAVETERHASNNSPEHVRALCQQGRLKEALHSLHVMDRRADSFTYASLLQLCMKKKAVSEGKLVHVHMNERGFVPNRFLGNTIMNMYVKCGSLVDARRVFDEMLDRDVCSWTVMIAAYSRHGLGEEALILFDQMKRSGIHPNRFTFASVLPACGNLAALEQGMEIHEEIMRSGFQSDVVVENALVDMYAKCGNIEKARDLFDKMPQRSVVSWNTMIAGYAQNKHFDQALNVFDKMPERDVVSWNAMISGYAQNGYVDEALKLFQKMPRPNVVSWNAIIAGYAQSGHGEEALKFFRQMQLAGVKPDSKTFASVFPACANLAALQEGMEIHEEIVRSGYMLDVFVENALVEMYAKCGRIHKAREIFDKMSQRNAVSWNTMIAGYVQNGHVDEALKLLRKMPKPDVVSWTTIIAGYTQNSRVDEALKLFQEMPQRDAVSWTVMITGYTQSGRVHEALQLFQEMPERDVASWTAMIAGYAQNGQGVEAINVYRQMQLAGVKPESKTFASVLPACANMAALEQGIEIHEEIIRGGFQSDVFVVNALLDMYAKCGRIEKARDIFDKMYQRNAVSWTTMIAGYAMHGFGKEALKLFEEMQCAGMKPDHVTLVCVLSACCHAGLVDEGQQYFNCMSQNYHITPGMEHYGCMVDLLGRAGRLDEAHDFINKMPVKPDAAVWRCLLAACRKHNNVELGVRVAERLFELDAKNAAPYVLLSNIYAAAGRWSDIEKVRRLMKDRMVKKTPGCSWIEVNKQVHAFLAGDKSHPQTHKIYAELEKLSRQMKEAGYLPDKRFVLNDVEEQQKEQILCQHSEKLAIAFGLINTPAGSCIRVIKNLRVCGDCHSAIKFISKIVAREIVVRDASRYHHFKDGWCSCGDYW
eukprot:Gb_21016 [translate_table: standard]